MIYALHDYDLEKKKRGAFVIKLEDAPDYNKDGYGIYWSVNTFKGTRRAVNLVKIRFWIADLDSGTKEDQMRRIKSLTYPPSRIVESKRGYHCYWDAINATKDNYKKIQEGIAKKLESDSAIKDVARILRYPNFLHLKDPNDPFMIKIIEHNNDKYTEKEMLYGFKIDRPKPNTNYKPPSKDDMLNPEHWERIFKLSNIVNGNRNNEIARITLWLRDSGFNGSDIENTVMEINNRINDPLPVGEINTILRGRV